jgi:hypothetical protein
MPEQEANSSIDLVGGREDSTWAVAAAASEDGTGVGAGACGARYVHMVVKVKVATCGTPPGLVLV